MLVHPVTLETSTMVVRYFMMVSMTSVPEPGERSEVPNWSFPGRRAFSRIDACLGRSFPHDVLFLWIKSPRGVSPRLRLSRAWFVVVNYCAGEADFLPHLHLVRDTFCCTVKPPD